MTRISDVSACFSLCTSQEPPLSCSSAQRLFHRLGRAMPCLALLHTSSKYVADRHFGGLQSEHKHKYVDPPPSECSFHHPEPKTTTQRVYLYSLLPLPLQQHHRHPTKTPTTNSTLQLNTSLTAHPHKPTQWPPLSTTSPTWHRRTSHLALAHHQPALFLLSHRNRGHELSTSFLSCSTYTWLWRISTSISTPHP